MRTSQRRTISSEERERQRLCVLRQTTKDWRKKMHVCMCVCVCGFPVLPFFCAILVFYIGGKKKIEKVKEKMTTTFWFLFPTPHPIPPYFISVEQAMLTDCYSRHFALVQCNWKPFGPTWWTNQNSSFELLTYFLIFVHRSVIKVETGSPDHSSQAGSPKLTRIQFSLNIESCY